VERLKVTPTESVAVIRAAGGLAVLAHPGWAQNDGLIPDLVAGGLDGIEVYYPDHSPVVVERYAAVARQYGLLVTGGTDFHGGTLATRVPVGSQIKGGRVAEEGLAFLEVNHRNVDFDCGSLQHGLITR
jgi:hypothetical protein